QFTRERRGREAESDQTRNDRLAKSLFNHKVRDLTCYVIYGVCARLSTRQRLHPRPARARGERCGEIRRRKEPHTALGPFDEPYVSGLRPVAQAKRLELARLAQAVEIQVHARDGARRIDLEPG